MIAYFDSLAGTRLIRALAIVAAWLFVTLGLGFPSFGNGDPAIIILIAVLSLSIGWLVSDIVISFVAAPTGKQARRKQLVFKGELPELSSDKKTKVRKLHKAMVAADMFAPQVPDVSLFFAGIADNQIPVDWMSMIMTLGEMSYYHPEVDPTAFSANIAWDALPENWQIPPIDREYIAIREDENLVFASILKDGSERLNAASLRNTHWQATDENGKADHIK